MPISPLSTVTRSALDGFQDLRSVPVHRHFGRCEYIDRFRKAIEFDYISISGLDVENFRFGLGSSLDTDLPPAFVESYIADNLAKADPFVAEALGRHTPVIESEVYAKTPPPPRLVYLARTFGVHNRTLIQLARNDIVYGAVCFTRSTPYTETEIDFLKIIADPIHTMVTKPLLDRFAAQELRLSRGELSCLSQASRGFTSEEIASVTGYQNDTVNTYIRSAVRKLGAKNRAEAVAEAIRQRLIE